MNTRVKTIPFWLILTALLGSCASTSTPLAPEGPASGIAGLPVLKDQNAESTSGVFFGIFRERTNKATVPDEVSKDLRFQPATVMWYTSWKGNAAFPKEEVLALSKQGVVPNITWEPWDWNLGVNDAGQIKLKDILDGKWDTYIRMWAKEARAVNVPILLRWGHEFNGNWYPWSVAANGQDPATYVKAYQHVHDLFTAEGANKVQWIWCYNNADVPGESWNDPARAYPGDKYVDWVGIDGYNWGTNPSWGAWVSFQNVFKGAYDRALKIAPSKPIILAEFASSEIGGSKPEWIQNMFSDLPKVFPQVKAIVWFDIQKEEDWRIDSSVGSKERMAIGLRSKYVRGNGAALLKVPASFGPVTPPTGNSKKIADFEALSDGRLTTLDGGKVFLSGFQQNAAQSSTFSNQDQGNEPPAVVMPAENGRSQRAAFDFGIKAPNDYAGVVLGLEFKPRNAENQLVAVDLSQYKTLRLTLQATGTSKVRLELIGDAALGIADGSHPQVYVDVSVETKTVDVPLSSFVQPDWAPVKKTTAEVLAKLVKFNLVADTVPSAGNVQVDDVMLLP